MALMVDTSIVQYAFLQLLWLILWVTMWGTKADEFPYCFKTAYLVKEWRQLQNSFLESYKYLRHILLLCILRYFTKIGVFILGYGYKMQDRRKIAWFKVSIFLEVKNSKKEKLKLAPIWNFAALSSASEVQVIHF